eukprot:2868950-Amphidinium_carterae.3
MEQQQHPQKRYRIRGKTRQQFVLAAAEPAVEPDGTIDWREWLSEQPSSAVESVDPSPVVNNLNDALGWFRDAVFRFGGSAYMKTLHQSLDGIWMSSAFSGIGAADVAMGCIVNGLDLRLDQKPTVANKFAIEKFKESQFELRCLPHPPECLFGDMCDVINKKVKQTLLSNVSKMSFENLVKVASRSQFCESECWCLQHDQMCKPVRVDLHVAGPPCVDFSRQGQQQGVNGPSILCFVCWCAQRLSLGDKAILHENVAQFPVHLLERFFSDTYIVQTVVVNSAILGHACDRERRLTWLLRKTEV